MRIMTCVFLCTEHIIWPLYTLCAHHDRVCLCLRLCPSVAVFVSVFVFVRLRLSVSVCTFSVGHGD